MLIRQSIFRALFVVAFLATVNMAHASMSLEHQLATINAGGYISEDHITVARFRSLLQQLSISYVEDRQQIADMSVKGMELLKENGVDESLLGIMEGLNQLFASKIENQKYAEYLGAYISLRVKGQAHSQAISGLQAILRALSTN